jgi:hypothetical protein
MLCTATASHLLQLSFVNDEHGHKIPLGIFSLGTVCLLKISTTGSPLIWLIAWEDFITFKCCESFNLTGSIKCSSLMLKHEQHLKTKNSHKTNCSYWVVKIMLISSYASRFYQPCSVMVLWYLDQKYYKYIVQHIGVTNETNSSSVLINNVKITQCCFLNCYMKQTEE